MVPPSIFSQPIREKTVQLMRTKEATLTDAKISPVKISTYIISIEITMANLTGSWSGELFTRNRQSSLALLGNLSTINQPTNLSMHT